jgi:hypothetical protein
MRQAEVSGLPNLFTVSGYKIYFWSNEYGEPIHVHVSKGKPSVNSTKYGSHEQADVSRQTMPGIFRRKS